MQWSGRHLARFSPTQPSTPHPSRSLSDVGLWLSGLPAGTADQASALGWKCLSLVEEPEACRCEGVLSWAWGLCRRRPGQSGLHGSDSGFAAGARPRDEALANSLTSHRPAGSTLGCLSPAQSAPAHRTEWGGAGRPWCSRPFRKGGPQSFSESPQAGVRSGASTNLREPRGVFIPEGPEPGYPLLVLVLKEERTVDVGEQLAVLPTRAFPTLLQRRRDLLCF